MKEKILTKVLKSVSSASTVCAGMAVNSSCFLAIYEPEMPECAKSLRKLD